MTAVRTRLPRWVVYLILAGLAFMPLAHGCHGDDVDHEPGVKRDEF